MNFDNRRRVKALPVKNQSIEGQPYSSQAPCDFKILIYILLR